MQSQNLVSNTVVVDILQRLLFSESKPSRLTPTDIAVMTYLILRRAVDHSIHDSHDTIAKRVCVERKAVMDSLARLESVRWITVESRGLGRTKSISINIEGLPAAEPVRSAITPEAKALVRDYYSELKKMGRKQFHKNWFHRQYPSGQRILTMCGGDLQVAHHLMIWALKSPRFKERSKQSTYHMSLSWKRIVEAYKDEVRRKQVSDETSGGGNDRQYIPMAA
jgi:hypothetical protein